MQPSMVNQGKLGQHAVLPQPQDKHSPYTRYSILDTRSIPPHPYPYPFPPPPFPLELSRPLGI